LLDIVVIHEATKTQYQNPHTLVETGVEIADVVYQTRHETAKRGLNWG
jgi:hypothetical protein